MQTVSRKSKIIARLKDPTFLMWVYIAFAAGATLSQYFQGPNWRFYTHYNNYLIFKSSFLHLVDNIDLYADQVPEHYDFYKYSPAFAVLMAPFAFLQDLPGLLLWNLLNALVLFFAVCTMPVKNENARIFILWFILQELLTTMQNSQSNGLMAGLLILGFNKFEKGKVFWAALFIALSAYIKIYGLLAAVLFLFYPNKIKFILSAGFWMLVFAALPLLFVSVDQLLFLYKSWYAIVAKDASTQYGVSILGMANKIFHLEPDKNLLLLSGLFLLLLPLIRVNQYGHLKFRINFLASLLIWLIIFNHRAESSTYIIAMTGIATWYFNSAKTKLDTTLAVVALIVTSFSTTDLFPSSLYYQFVKPYKLKALPCLLIWIKISADLLVNRFEDKSYSKELKPEIANV